MAHAFLCPLYIFTKSWACTCMLFYATWLNRKQHLNSTKYNFLDMRCSAPIHGKITPSGLSHYHNPWHSHALCSKTLKSPTTQLNLFSNDHISNICNASFFLSLATLLNLSIPLAGWVSLVLHHSLFSAVLPEGCQTTASMDLDGLRQIGDRSREQLGLIFFNSRLPCTPAQRPKDGQLNRLWSVLWYMDCYIHYRASQMWCQLSEIDLGWRTAHIVE